MCRDYLNVQSRVNKIIITIVAVERFCSLDHAYSNRDTTVGVQ
jgi:hypothetical protein